MNANFQAVFLENWLALLSPGKPYWTVCLRFNLCIDCVSLRVCVFASAAGGEIFDHCVSDELLPESQITRLIRQTLEGVHHLHQSNLVHLDLKVRARTRKSIYHHCKQAEKPQYKFFSAPNPDKRT